MTLALHEMGFHHLKGETRNIIAKSAGNVDFRKVYIERKLANRVALCSGRLFRPTRGLCKTLQRYGGCNIYVNGASYHKRDANNSPRKKWLKADTQEWLRKNAGIVFSPKATIDILLGNVEFYRPKEEYMATKIAVKYGHLVFFTPPYHPSLQPIELFWGTVKNRIAKDPPRTVATSSPRCAQDSRRARETG
ncbi:hypothetical protein PF003_g1046 [Phytophthora fragariae]|nr:hypothetical protein PF003_g1046 [Phytophthora fragariae]